MKLVQYNEYLVLWLLMAWCEQQGISNYHAE